MGGRAKRVFELVSGQNKWRGNCINLIASENVMSPAAKAVYSSDFAHRYAEGLPGKRYYQGTKFIDEVEAECTKLFASLFKADFADVRSLGGANANMAIFASLVEPGDTYLSPGIGPGGHISSEKFGCAGVRGLDVHNFVFDPETLSIDVPATIERMNALKPKLVGTGASMFQFPHPVKELSKAAKDLGAVMWFDAAHVAGLVAAGKFQQPFQEGATVMTMSTHKTFPGPQGGAIVAVEGFGGDNWKKIQRAVFPGLTSNHHLHKLPSLWITCLEFEEFGEAYASQVVANAKALGKEMDALGFDVLWKSKGFTESHQIAVDVRKQGGGKKVAEELEKANIILNKNMLPFDDVKKSHDPSGVRIGVQEMTRFGMREKEMRRIAELIAAVAAERKPSEGVRVEVEALRKEFPEQKYCYPASAVNELLESSGIAR